MNPYIVTPNSISVILGGKSYIINDGHPNYAAIREAIRVSDWNSIAILVDIPKTIVRASKGSFEITDDNVTYKGESVHNVVATRILQFLNEGQDFKPLLNFLERLYNNPSKRSIDELYKFLEHKNLPLDADGYFYAYKAVTNDFKDKHSGKFDNHIGNIVEIERRNVDDDARHACSYGLHVGSLEYVRSFAHGYGNLGGDNIIIVKVDPAHVVSVPYDCNCQKVRVERYQVVELFTGELPETVYGENDRLIDDWFDDDENNDDDEAWDQVECPGCWANLGNLEFCENCCAYIDEWKICDSCGEYALETYDGNCDVCDGERLS